MAATVQEFIIQCSFNMKYEKLDDAQAAGVAPWDDFVREDFHVVVFRDRYPVTPGHLLFVPVYNTEGLIKDAFGDAVQEGERMIAAGECDGYNVGLNMGTAAGQTVMYPHVHLIPRRTGDCADPVGGVRGVIFGQANYKKTGYQIPV
jgi:diadenosine tetraphosphate (Ap4A) HIT family hydrolase